MSAGMPPGASPYGQPPPQYQAPYGQPQPQGYPIQPQQAAPPQGYQGTYPHEPPKGYSDYGHPGGRYFTGKQLFTRDTIVLTIGMAIGALLMFRAFPILIAWVTAVSGV